MKVMPVPESQATMLMNFRVVLCLAILATCQTPSFGQSIVERANRDEITHMSSETPAMRDAFRKAAATLDGFLSAASSPKPGTSDFALKVAISDSKNTEYFWVGDFAKDGERFTGVLNNEPRLVKKYKFGERITFSRPQIVDWVYSDQAGKRMLGNFTACALLTNEPPQQAEQFKQRYGLTCD